MNREFISEKYQFVETRENFDTEGFILVKNIDNNQEYLLQYFDLSSLSISEIDNLKGKINLVKNFANNPLNNGRFPLIIEIVEYDNYLNIIYEKIKGKSLKELLNNKESWREIEAINYFKYLLESLDLLHSFDLIHQLIKPENLIINHENIVISNYGRFIPPQSSLRMTITVEDKLYIAPEQIKSKPHISSDIYALAMVIIALVTGKDILSFNEDETGKIIWSDNVNLNDSFIAILERAIAPNLSERYQNCQEVIAEINQFFPPEKREDKLTAKQENIAHYIPTEIITPDDNLNSFNHQENQKILNSTDTEFVNSSDYDEDKKQTNLDKTELIFPEEKEENITSLLPLVEEYLSNSYSLSSENSPKINNKIAEKVSSLPLNNSQNNTNLISKIPPPKAMIIAFIVSLLIIFTFAWAKTYFYQKKVENLIQEIKGYYEQEKYDECITLINSNTIQSLPVADSLTQEFLGKCWLGLAEKKALDSNFAEAIKIAVQIDNKSPDYNRARQFIDDWSEQLLEEAKTLCDTGTDIAIVEEKLAPIPESSKWKKDALNLIDTCGKNKVGIPLCPGPLCPD